MPSTSVQAPRARANFHASERTVLVSTILTAFLIWCSRTQLSSSTPMRAIEARRELAVGEHEYSILGVIAERTVITVRPRPLWGLIPGQLDIWQLVKPPRMPFVQWCGESVSA